MNPTKFPVVPVGTILLTGSSSLPQGYLPCDGSEVSRAEFSDLFLMVGTTFGDGDGVTTFNLPDLGERFPLGLGPGPIGTGSLMGEFGGSLDHVHFGGTHAHSVVDHAHTVQGHAHTLGDHVHGLAGHAHTVAGHNHGKGSLNILNSGDHSHSVTKETQADAVTGGNRNRIMRPDNSGTVGADMNLDCEVATHDHPSSSFNGLVGSLLGPSGDGPLATSASSGATVSGGQGSTGSNLSAGSGPGGAGVTGFTSGSPTTPQNPPYLTVNYMIKS